jgi:N-acetylmuramoyl-L-alanine amidase
MVTSLWALRESPRRFFDLAEIVVESEETMDPERASPEPGRKPEIAPEPVNPDQPAEMVIVIDPGHGGKDGGGVANGHVEKNLALDVSLRVVKRLRQRGLKVKMTREDDTYISLSGRAAFSNALPNALFTSIHFNTSRYASAYGIETFYSDPKSADAAAGLLSRLRIPETSSVLDRRGELFATTVQEACVQATGARDRGARKASYSVTRNVIGPSILVECGFMTNDAEAKKIRSSAYLDKIADGIADGIAKYVEQCQGDIHYGVVEEVRP